MINLAAIPQDVQYAKQFWDYQVKGSRWGSIGPCRPSEAFEMIQREVIVILNKEDVTIIPLKFGKIKGRKDGFIPTLLPLEEGVSGYNL